jgi:hypothetical protein
MPFTVGLGSYTIIWMRNGDEIAREACGLRNAAEVVHYAHAKVASRTADIAGKRATEFRIQDESGREISRHAVTD